MPTTIHWFRRDLRLHDNPALHAALEAGAGHCIPVFILDEKLLRSPNVGAARAAFLLSSLRALDHSLRERGSRLLLRRGDPAECLAELAAKASACGLYYNRDYTLYASRRDALIETRMAAQGVACHGFNDTMLIEPGALLNKAGAPYQVFTPYQRRWRAQVAARPERPLPAFAPLPLALDAPELPDVAELGFSTSQPIPPGGESAGLARLADFAQVYGVGGMRGYAAGRDTPALPATSRLGPYLRFGCVAPAACLRAALRVLDLAEPGAQPGIETWLGELAWRDFYQQIVAHFPHVLRGAFRRQYDAIEWENDAGLFASWQAGQTGYPIVDAAMRQLAREAWMHNRARMIVASFLTKSLLIDWRWGERHFMQQLVDGDPAANNGGWQWAAGTGTDPQPYFRIFNPVSQGRKFDPRGAYVRAYVPELARVPDRFIHAPWLMPAEQQRALGVQIGRDYPAPLVVHAERRERALALYRAARATSP